MNQSNDGTPSNDGATADAIREQVAQAYTAAIEHRTGPERAPCCGPSDEAKGEAKAAQANACCAGPSYTIDQLDGVSETVAGASFGCGNPVAFADVSDGSVVLDLGSGAGLDLLLAAERVGDAGRVIGVDMTDAMLETARRNLDASPIGQRVELRKGVIEALPVEDASVDHVISNCVINLSPDKTAVFREIARVLKPGGSMVVSDIVANDLPEWLANSREAWPSCVAGAISETEYVAGLGAAGLTDVSVDARLMYDSDQIRGILGDEPQLLGVSIPAEILNAALTAVDGKVASVRFRASKPSTPSPSSFDQTDPPEQPAA